ncbi:MAG: hypothetical protein LBM65_03165 [Oscillospiraceae bacterium]|jgi:hypothetical protein|nr:hypothetical protein [Oscillospiraceae bacterium]
MSIQTQAAFWRKSVCDISLRLEAHIKQTTPDSEDLLRGLRTYSNLLKDIYSQYTLFEVSKAESVMTKIGVLADDLENYNTLRNMTECLMVLFKSGEVITQGAEYSLRVDKASFETQFKKPPKPYFEWLEHFGFGILFYKNSNEVKAYAGSDSIEILYEDCPPLLYAVRYVAENITDEKGKDKLSPVWKAFSFADFEALYGSPETALYDLPQNVLNCAGKSKVYLEQFISTFVGEGKAEINLTLQPYVFPCWNVIFKQGKRNLCKFAVKADCVTTFIPLSYEAAKLVVDESATYTAKIQYNIKRFGCVACGKCANAASITKYEGYNLCRIASGAFGTEYPMIIKIDVDTQSDAESVSSIINKVLLTK